MVQPPKDITWKVADEPEDQPLTIYAILVGIVLVGTYVVSNQASKKIAAQQREEAAVAEDSNEEKEYLEDDAVATCIRRSGLSLAHQIGAVIDHSVLGLCQSRIWSVSSRSCRPSPTSTSISSNSKGTSSSLERKGIVEENFLANHRAIDGSLEENTNMAFLQRVSQRT